MSVLRVVIDGIRDADRKREGRGTPQLLLALPRISLILITGWILIAGVWQVDLSAALTALGVTSLIISFALQDTLSGLAAGILLLSDQPFKTGDWITTGDTVGRVTDINWRTTRIETRDGSLVIVPNSELAGTIVTNHSAPHPLHRVSVEVSVAFVNPPTLAKDMLLDAALATPGVLLDPPPVVKVIMVDDPLMGYEAQMWIEDFKTAPQVESDFGALVWYQSHRHNVPLPSPAQISSFMMQPPLVRIRARLHRNCVDVCSNHPCSRRCPTQTWTYSLLPPHPNVSRRASGSSTPGKRTATYSCLSKAQRAWCWPNPTGS